MASDARDILNESVPTPPPPATVLAKKTSKSKRKRPEGMNLELYQLLGQGQDPCPLVPTHAAHGGYKARARLSNNKTRSWKWSEFDNKARVDGLRLKHWAVQEQQQEEKTSHFADFNRNVPFPAYDERQKSSDDWSGEETDYMMQLCKQFDCRFIIVHDRYDEQLHGKQRRNHVEDIKERFYRISAPTNGVNKAGNSDGAKVPYVYDVAHEKNRKKQLDLYLRRTRKEIEEQEKLRANEKKSERKKGEREKREAEQNRFAEKTFNHLSKKNIDINGHHHPPEKKKKRNLSGYSGQNNKSPQQQVQPNTPPHHTDSQGNWDENGTSCPVTPQGMCSNRPPEFGLRFPELKSGIHLQSSRMILPISTSRKRETAISVALKTFNVDPQPIATERVTGAFNTLRSDIVKLRDCEVAIQHCDIELQALSNQYAELFPDKPLPKGVDKIAARKRVLSESATLPEKKKTKNCP